MEEVPCGDQFPTCKFIKNSHKSKKTLINQEANLISLNTNLSDLRQMYYKVKDKELEEKTKLKLISYILLFYLRVYYYLEIVSYLS